MRRGSSSTKGVLKVSDDNSGVQGICDAMSVAPTMLHVDVYCGMLWFCREYFGYLMTGYGRPAYLSCGILKGRELCDTVLVVQHGASGIQPGERLFLLPALPT